MERFERDNPHLKVIVGRWRAAHPAGTLADAVRDLQLWERNPQDRDAEWYVWRQLYDLSDPVATTAGFPAMRSAAAARQKRKKQRTT